MFELLGCSLFETGFLFCQLETSFLGVVPTPHPQHPQAGQCALINFDLIIPVTGQKEVLPSAYTLILLLSYQDGFFECVDLPRPYLV